jgi:hypothetical protein
MHELACEAGVFSTKYARNAFTLLTGDLELNIKMDVDPPSVVDVKTLVFCAIHDVTEEIQNAPINKNLLTYRN